MSVVEELADRGDESVRGDGVRLTCECLPLRIWQYLGEGAGARVYPWLALAAVQHQGRRGD